MGLLNWQLGFAIVIAGAIQYYLMDDNDDNTIKLVLPSEDKLWK
jgi:hypothetical protein